MSPLIILHVNDQMVECHESPDGRMNSLRMGELIQIDEANTVYRVMDIKHRFKTSVCKPRFTASSSILDYNRTEIWLEPVTVPETLNSEQLFGQFPRQPGEVKFGEDVPAEFPGVNTGQMIEQVASPASRKMTLEPAPPTASKNQKESRET